METSKVNTPIDPRQIKGWGVDADPENDPTYPMRNRMNVTQDPTPKNRPDNLQPVNTEVLRSVERPNVTAVYGTPEPPSGLSGMIRRFAFRYTENEYMHWLPLILADRVDMVEGLVADLAKGEFPNIWAEKGYDMDWKYKRGSLILKLSVLTALTAGAVVLLSSGSKDSKDSKKKSYRTKYRY